MNLLITTDLCTQSLPYFTEVATHSVAKSIRTPDHYTHMLLLNISFQNHEH